MFPDEASLDFSFWRTGEDWIVLGSAEPALRDGRLDLGRLLRLLHLTEKIVETVIKVIEVIGDFPLSNWRDLNVDIRDTGTGWVELSRRIEDRGGLLTDHLAYNGIETVVKVIFKGLVV